VSGKGVVPKLFLILTCLDFPLRDNISKNSFLGLLKVGAIHPWYLLQPEKGHIPYLAEILSLSYCCPWELDQ
jgi:hypothetical protein